MVFFKKKVGRGNIMHIQDTFKINNLVIFY